MVVATEDRPPHRPPEKGPQNEGPFPDFGGSTGVGGGSAFDSLAAERLRRAPSRGPSGKGTNQNGSRSCPGEFRFKEAEEEGEKGGCFAVPREDLGD